MTPVDDRIFREFETEDGRFGVEFPPYFDADDLSFGRSGASRIAAFQTKGERGAFIALEQLTRRFKVTVSERDALLDAIEEMNAAGVQDFLRKAERRKKRRLRKEGLAYFKEINEGRGE